MTITRAIAVPRTGSVQDFDFLVGTWDVANRRLKSRWSGCTEWDEFPAINRCGSRLGSIVNIDEIEFFTRGFSGMTVRVFDLAQQRWSIYWINSRTGVMEPPVTGAFVGDVGVFRGRDTDEGRPIEVIFRWTRLGSHAARWEQAFSLDGETWETNWVMDMTRRED
jgi:hypothetical protein